MTAISNAAATKPAGVVRAVAFQEKSSPTFISMDADISSGCGATEPDVSECTDTSGFFMGGPFAAKCRVTVVFEDVRPAASEPVTPSALRQQKRGDCGERDEDIAVKDYTSITERIVLCTDHLESPSRDRRFSWTAISARHSSMALFLSLVPSIGTKTRLS
jgi:hypothetical protein